MRHSDIVLDDPSYLLNGTPGIVRSMGRSTWCVIFFLVIVVFVKSSLNAKKKTCLLVSVDNRELNPDLHDHSYASKTAVLNLAYAKYHNYDFLYVQNTVTDVEKDTRKQFPDADIVPPTDNAKDAATAFHVGLKQFRAASWAKLPALWHVTTTVGKLLVIFLNCFVIFFKTAETSFHFLQLYVVQEKTMSIFGTLTLTQPFRPYSGICLSRSWWLAGKSRVPSSAETLESVHRPSCFSTTTPGGMTCPAQGRFCTARRRR
jgi:hypothetical protein